MRTVYWMILGVLGLCFLVIPPPTAAKICLPTEPGDSQLFGHALAASKDYLAVGDPQANRVVFYWQKVRGEWSRAREILPPIKSTAAQVKAGFGYALSLDDGILVIGAHHQILPGVTPRSGQNHSAKFVSGIFIVDLNNLIDKPSEQLKVESISPSNSLKDAVYGFDVSIDGSLIAFGLRQEVKPGIWHGSVGVLRRETSQQDIEIIAPPEGDAKVNFGVSTDIANHLLIAAAPRSGSQGTDLFDLTRQSGWQPLLEGENKPANGWFGGHVALSSSLALLGGDAGAPLVTSSAAITMSGSDTRETRYVFPGGRGAIHGDFAVIAAARPTPLPPSAITPSFDNVPTLNIVDATGVCPVTLKDPSTDDPIDDVQALAVSDSVVVVAQRSQKSRCKVFTVSRTFLNQSSSTTVYYSLPDKSSSVIPMASYLARQLISS